MTEQAQNYPQVRFSQIARSLVRGLPRFPVAMKGIGLLLTVGPEKKLSIGALLEQWARRTPSHIALRDERGDLSYADFNRQANRWASVLKDSGVKRGDTVAIVLENRKELLVAVAATVKLGAIAGMINNNQRGDVLAHSLNLVKASALIVGDECREALASVADRLPAGLKQNQFWLAEGEGDCPVDCRDLQAEANEVDATNPPETASLPSSAPAFYIFTSGTTGMPKAAVMSHRRWLRAMAGMGLASMGMRRDDVLYCPLPLYHNNALTVSWSAVLGSGATLAIARRFSASRFWEDIQRTQATAFCYIGELCRYLLAQPVKPEEREHHLRICIGNGLRPELWQEFRERFAIPHINEFYGASECNLVFTNTFDIDGSCGFCPLAFEVVAYDVHNDQPLRDDQGRLIPVDTGEKGLLLAKVTERSPFDGYTDKRDSEKKLLRDGLEPGDCWFNTGDLVRKLGYRHIQFVDRTGDTFRWKGENVATTEVEAVVDGFEQVEQSVVYGVEVPGADGRAGMAALTLNVEPEQFDTRGFANYLRDKLPAYALPLFLRLRDQHETTSTFKSQRVSLREQGFRVEEESVFVLPANADGFLPLTEELRGQLESQSLRL